MPVNPAQRGYIRSFVDLGGETLINSETNSNQREAEVTILTNGNIFVAWESNLQDGSGLGIFAKLLSADGTALTGDLPMNVTTSGDQTNPQVVALDNGRAMVVWQSGGDIWGRFIEVDGTSPASEFLINETSYAADFEITKFASDDFVITWEANDGSTSATSVGVYAQRFQFNGTKEWDEIRVNDNTTLNQRNADTAELNSGTVFTVFQSQGQVGAISEQGVYLRNYSNTSTLVGSDLVVSDEIGVQEIRPQIEALSGGGFVVAYFVGQELYAKSYLNTGAEIPSSLAQITEGIGSQNNMPFELVALPDNRYVVVWVSPGSFGNDLHYRVVEGDGTSLNTGMVHTLTSGTQNFPEVHALPQGGFVTAYVTGSSTLLNINIVRHAEDGTPVGPPTQVEYPVNTNTANAQIDPEIAVTQDGELVITWNSSVQDGSGTGIYMQRLDVSTIGTSGDDVMDGTKGADFLGGWLGKDTISGGRGDDTLEGGAGQDVIYGGPGNDYIDGGVSADMLFGGGGNDEIYAMSGRDRLDGGAGRDNLFGEEGDDLLFGGRGGDSLFGGGDDDSLSGGGGGDHLSGGKGKDDISGQGGRDQLIGNGGGDVLSGGGGADSLFGGGGRDSLSGGSGRDDLQGGGGRDVLEGGAGDDRLSGQRGNDHFEFARGSGDDVITDFDAFAREKLRLDEGLWSGTKSRRDVVDDHASVVGSDIVFTFGSDTLTLEGVSDLSALVNDIQFI
ncbi:calcium-binding protein [Neptunicoccus cionae]|uniref:Calcium-binding protein n=1 Tax=Neptunicoccus cionae TaxID=2035344 RepID=A0A916VSX8_9RHOB|nr:calcium-binding protein [Amylibacter cionae]GGA28756.1 hypothetical protein GCM10011498_32370 [Amylibacter cionae]